MAGRQPRQRAGCLRRAGRYPRRAIQHRAAGASGDAGCQCAAGDQCRAHATFCRQNGSHLPNLAPLRTQETYNRSFELGREVSVTRDAVGTVRRISVAVALDTGAGGKARTPQEIAQLENLVKNAVGFDAVRGDTVALTSRGFVKNALGEDASTPIYEAPWFKMLVRNLSALAVVIVVVMGIGKPLLKKIGEMKTAPTISPRRTGRQAAGNWHANVAGACQGGPGQPRQPCGDARHDHSTRIMFSGPILSATS